MYVYLLQCSDKSTYIGATVDLNRRLRQHNGEIQGGAKRTTGKLKKGKTWTRICHVSELPDWTATLQFEWRWKQLSRKYNSNMDPLERRIRALHDLLSLDRSTSKAVPYEEWTSKPIVHIEENDYVELCATHLIGDTYDIE